MSETVKIKIAKIGRKEFPSKFKEGETYNITTIQDELTGRKGAAMGKWADAWKVGETIEGVWEKRTYKDKDGFEQESWNIKNPEQKPAGKGSGSWAPKKPTLVDAYQIAAALSPILFRDKKIKLDDITKLADEIMKRLNAATPAVDAQKPAGKDVDLNKEETVAKKPETKKKDDDFEVDEEETSSKSEDDEDEEDIF